jgi:hypothetical protein
VKLINLSLKKKRKKERAKVGAEKIANTFKDAFVQIHLHGSFY